ncbi:hypothetical protein LM73068_310168 [Listeria monocytogenes]|nr:hypothetical protein LM4423_100474 [Listeria monocytogenes 4423]CUK96278.1 hypothetical protein LM701014_420168 [Listeria monocytogenes]CUL15310.1 hypothetical protein LM701377_280066 [Listeria monocytogenes]CUL18860.1 hypothetical protein LM701398_400168 [Listeria monocytogenes]CUL34761.1 hypothetical protein LM73068_310168 [Listeria monocytogenes]
MKIKYSCGNQLHDETLETTNPLMIFPDNLPILTSTKLD